MAMTYATIMCCAGGVQADGCHTKKVTAKGGNLNNQKEGRRIRSLLLKGPV